MPTCPPGGERCLTPGEVALVDEVFEGAVATDGVRIVRRRWHPLQSANLVMAPSGSIHFHPQSARYRDDFATADLSSQGLFIHEMTHVWQAQLRGRWYLPLMRHPFCRYHYTLVPGWPLERYGLEQQAEIVRHAFLLRRGAHLPGVSDAGAYKALVRFGRKAFRH